MSGWLSSAAARILAAALFLSAYPIALRDAHAASVSPRVLSGQTPLVVARGVAPRLRPHNASAVLTLDMGLNVRDSAALDAIIAAASDPSSPSYGHYLTRTEYLERFAPTEGDVQAVRDWVTARGLSVQAVSPDRLFVTVRGTTGQVERALGVHLDDYTFRGRTFIANDRDPAVPAGLPVRAISGLSTLHRFHTSYCLAHQGCSCYDPNDFRAAYNAGPVGDAAGQTIGLTLWGAPVPQSDLDAFAANTNTPRLVTGQAGANGIDWIPVNGGSTDMHQLAEVAMDAEYAHGVAPNSHLKYWLADCTYDPHVAACIPSDAGLEQIVDAAANDPDVHIVSNSWGGDEATSTNDPFVSNIDAALQYAASVGTTFFFSSGDSGYLSGCDPSDATCSGLSSFPADSPYAVAVGGTSLYAQSDGTYNGEVAWGGAGNGASGGGCSLVFARPSWQTGVSAATCPGRAVPDVAADADPLTGAYVYANGTSTRVGGTSLSTPLWAGLSADMNHYLTANGSAPIGWVLPRLYYIANSAAYGQAFHDITRGTANPQASGTSGYAAGSGWDEATGWGSPNLAALATAWTNSVLVPTATTTSLPPAPTATPTNTPVVPTATDTPIPTATPIPLAPTPTSTSLPAATNTPVPTHTATATPTVTPSPTATRRSTATRPTPTRTPQPRTTQLPTHAAILSLSLPTNKGHLYGNALVSVTLHLSPHATATVTLALTRTTVAWSGRGAHRKRVMHTAVLYHTRGVRVTADKAGRAAARIRLAYTPRSTMSGVTLVATVRAGHLTLSRTVRVTLLPPPRAHAQESGSGACAGKPLLAY